MATRRKPNRTLRLEKPKGVSDRRVGPSKTAQPKVSGDVMFNFGGKSFRVPILSSQDEMQSEIEKAKKFLRLKFKKLFG